MPVELWTSEPFLAEAAAWVDAHLPDGATRTGEWEQPHARPWSSAIRYETTAGTVWFKVNGPGSGHEPPLTALLADLLPDLVPEVLAVAPDRRWSLLGDAGPVMRVRWSPEESWDRWALVLQRYAEAQRTLADHREAILACGVDDQSPGTLSARLDALVEDLAARPEDDGGLSGADADRLRALREEYDGWCRELAAAGVPSSLNHDDLHSSNVCVPEGTDVDRARVIDWGDSVWTHAFGVLLATLNSAAWHAGVEVDDPRVHRLRDAYLEVWGDLGSTEERRHLVRLARRTGCVTKALSYVRAFEGEPRAAEAEWDWPVRAWLLETLDPAVAG